MDRQNSDEVNANTDGAPPATESAASQSPDSARDAQQPDADSASAQEPSAGRGRWIAAAVAALGVALYAVPFIRGPELSTPRTESSEAASRGSCSASKGAANFDFTLKDMSGADVRLSDFKGKVILLNFWATWCGPCKVEIPEFVEAYNEYRDRGFVILAVLSQDDPSADELQAFANDWGMKYPIFREHLELDEAFGPMWGIPTSFIIDRHGSICTKHLGPVPKDVLEQEIERLL